VSGPRHVQPAQSIRGAIGGPDIPGVSVIDAAGVQRVVLGAIGGGDYGLRVTSADGTTVILDGTSNMFKIAAQGTTSLNVADQSAGSATVDITALTEATTLALLSFAGQLDTAGAARRVAAHIVTSATRFVAATSGGAVTTRAIVMSEFQSTATSIVAGSPRFTFSVINETGGAVDRYATYYFLKEAAM